MHSLTNHLRSRRRLAVIACLVGLLAAPAAASAHGYYDMSDPAATAPDGHYVVSMSWYSPQPAEGMAVVDMISFSCQWSDGTVDDCTSVWGWSW